MMQFRRESDNDARRLGRSVPTAAISAVMDKLGWMCTLEPDHFHYAQLAARPDRRDPQG